jgi:hypothetical protein
MSSIHVINKGTKAGGINTNKNGLPFEMLVSNANNLENNGFEKTLLGKGKHAFYLSKKYNNIEIYYTTKKGFKQFIKEKFGIVVCKEPDEAFIKHNFTDNVWEILILEVKNQNCEGSVEEKLLAGNTIRRLYEKMLGCKITIHYGYCLSKFLKNKYLSNTLKYNILLEIFNEQQIYLFYGEDENYIEKLNSWVGI